MVNLFSANLLQGRERGRRTETVPDIKDNYFKFVN